MEFVYKCFHKDRNTGTCVCVCMQVALNIAEVFQLHQSVCRSPSVCVILIIPSFSS